MHAPFALQSIRSLIRALRSIPCEATAFATRQDGTPNLANEMLE
jgi:hypothetical protein